MTRQPLEQITFASYGLPIGRSVMGFEQLRTGLRTFLADKRGVARDEPADVAAVVADLDLRKAVHIGHSTGGGEALHYAARHGEGRVAKLVLIGAVPPIMLKTAANPGGLPIEVFFTATFCLSGV